MLLMPDLPVRKPLFILKGEIRTPPFEREARREAGDLLRRIQDGESLGMPHSRPLPTVGPRCHEMRVKDSKCQWRIVYRIDDDAILIAGIFAKKGKKMQQRELKAASARLATYDRAT